LHTRGRRCDKNERGKGEGGRHAYQIVREKKDSAQNEVLATGGSSKEVKGETSHRREDLPGSRLLLRRKGFGASKQQGREKDSLGSGSRKKKVPENLWENTTAGGDFSLEGRSISP